MFTQTFTDDRAHIQKEKPKKRLIEPPTLPTMVLRWVT